MSKKISDDIVFEIEGEFKELTKMVRDLEMIVEESLFELSDNVDRDFIDALIEGLTDFLIKYDDFLFNVMSIAGEVRGVSEIGSKVLENLEKIKTDAKDASLELGDLRGMIKKSIAESQSISKIKQDLIKRINEKISRIKEYVTNQIIEDLKKLEKELEKAERYYEETE